MELKQYDYFSKEKMSIKVKKQKGKNDSMRKTTRNQSFNGLTNQPTDRPINESMDQ